MGRLKVTQELLKKHPLIMDDFSKWYANKYDIDSKPEINQFFAILFKFQLFAWIDYLANNGVTFTIKKHTIEVNANPGSSLHFVNTMNIDEDVLLSINEASEALEHLIANIIIHVNQPF